MVPLLLLMLAACLPNLARSQCTASSPTYASVPENSPNGTLVLKFGEDKPSSPYTDLTSHPDYGCYFYANDMGLYMNRVFDLEFPASCDGGNITGSAIGTINADLKCSSTRTLIVIITGLDEFSPEFRQPLYSYTVSESQPVGYDIYTFKEEVQDKDYGADTSHNFGLVNSSIGASKFTTTYEGKGLTSGRLRIEQPLDYDAGIDHREYLLNLSATDKSGKVAYTTVKITVTDFDDLSPRFTQDTYRLTFTENDTSQINVSLPTQPPLIAHDMDFGINQTIEYRIESGSNLQGQSFLSINATTGEFIVTRLIDREELITDEILVQVKAYQTDKPETRIALATVIVTVKDKNDNAPVIEPSSVNVSIAENSAVGTYVTRLVATDKDLNSSSEFVLVDGSGAFQIDAVTGVVTVQNGSLLDREATAEFNFLVFARERYTVDPFTSNNASVQVRLIDTNDNSPHFGQSSYVFNVSETALNGTNIGYLNATDLDSGLNGLVVLSLSYASDNGLDVIYMEPDTGALRLKAVLSNNPTFVSTYQLVATAVDQATVVKDRRSSLALVRVNVLSESVTPPAFTQAVFVAKVTEAAPVGSDVLRLTATHKYPGMTLNYSLVSQTGSDKFTVVSVSNDGFVRIASALDRETVDFYNLTAVVSDGTLNDSAQVLITVLDYNDQTPVFNDSSAGYNFSVQENLATPVLVGRVWATDADQAGTSNAMVQYSLVGSQAETYFSVNSSTGELFTRDRTASLDRETTPSFVFTVMARDSGSPTALSSTATVRIEVGDVNDNPAEFALPNSATVSLVEKGTYADFLQLKFTDADLGSNQDSRFALEAPTDLNGTFVINDTTGHLSSTRSLTQSLFGGSDSHNITVVVYNVLPLVNYTGSPNRTSVVTVVLLGANDNRPVFVERVFAAIVAEDIAVGQEVTNVKANDLDSAAPYSTVVYNITDGNALGKFRLNSNTGVLTLAEALNYDAPNNNTAFYLQIVAYNPTIGAAGYMLNDTAEIKITVQDVNDNAPVFSLSQYEFLINETHPNGSLINSSIRATDKDSTPNTTAAVFYELRPSDVPFAIDNITGDLRLAGSISRDKGGPASYTFLAAAVNLASTPQLSGVATIIVRVDNVNNNPPIFSAPVYNFTVVENAPRLTSVGSLGVSDLDGNAVRLTIVTAGDGFFMESNSLLTNASIDRESLSTNPIELVVRASDGVHEANASVWVTVADVNDNAPQFVPSVTEQTVGLLEAAPNGTFVVQLNTTDADVEQNGNVTYRILTAGSPFTINGLSGEVTVANGNLLDYQKQPEIPVLIVASDEGRPKQSTFLTLKVQLTDTNDKPVTFNPSAYAATVLENQASGTLVTKLYASDADTIPTGFNFSLPKPADATLFYLDNAVGTKEVSLLLNVSLDRENQSLYFVLVAVTDGRFSHNATVNVTVGDENDNPPKFEQTSYTFFVDELSPIDHPVGEVKATDLDSGINAQITYFLSGGNEKFHVNFRTGALTVKSSLNGTAGTTYNVQVTARDQGSPSQNSQTSVTLIINETNANTPVFSPALYTVSLQESAAVNTSIVNVTASDADFPSINGIISYSITLDNSTSKLFSINDTSGEIKLVGALDYESTTSYTLMVLATDHAAAPRTGTATVLLAVGNDDDTQPTFVPDSYLFFAPQNASTGFMVGSVNAIDPDYPSASPQPITYSLSSSSFQVNQSTGLLTVSSTPLSVDNVSLSVISTDASMMNSTATVIVSVIPADEYYAKVPIFSSPNMVASVLENQTEWLFVIDVNATLNGGAIDAGVSYRLDIAATSFNISNSGTIDAKPNTLDQEASSELSVMVTALNSADPSFFSTAVVRVQLVDINDNAPRFAFNTAEVTVLENATIGHVVTQLQAFDPDVSSTNLTYTIVSDNSGGKFRLEASGTNSSQLLVNSTLDYEAMSSLGYVYSLSIEVSDGNFTSTYSLTVRIGNVNDNPPVFKAAIYNFTVPEKSAEGKFVGRVIATDPDAEDLNKLVYSLSGTSLLVINNSTGEVKTQSVFDRLLVTEISFNVTCTDTAGNMGSSHVNVLVTDINNHNPNITNLPATWNITENATSVGQYFEIVVEDKDFGQNGNVSLSIVSGDSWSSFVVNGSHIKVIGVLDREASGLVIDPSSGNGVISLVIRATDAGVTPMSSSATLTVMLQDVNDSPPRFSIPAGREFQQAESLPVNSVIATFDMLDADLPASNNFTFSISAATNPNGTFSMQENYLVLSKPLIREEKASHNLTVICSDGVFTISTYIIVSVVDSNNYSPVFTSLVYAFNVTENDASKEIGQFIGVVSAVDKDTGLNGQVVYSVAAPSSLRSVLAISENGTVTLNGTVDREATGQLIFLIKAADMGISPRFGTAELQLTLLDVNDNRPEFTATTYTGTVAENSAATTLVTLNAPIQATDRDIGNNSFIEYSISGDQAAWFSINQAGQIQVASGALLDRENQSTFTFNVTANNTRGEPTWLSQTALVTITLTDVNDNAPVFSKPSLAVLLNLSTVPPPLLLQAIFPLPFWFSFPSDVFHIPFNQNLWHRSCPQLMLSVEYLNSLSHSFSPNISVTFIPTQPLVLFSFFVTFEILLYVKSQLISKALSVYILCLLIILLSHQQ